MLIESKMKVKSYLLQVFDIFQSSENWSIESLLISIRLIGRICDMSFNLDSFFKSNMGNGKNLLFYKPIDIFSLFASFFVLHICLLLSFNINLVHL